MTTRFPIRALGWRALATALALLAGGGGVLAQSCDALKAEYRSLATGGAAAAAQREYRYLASAYQQLGCGGGFFFFGPHPACSGIAGRMRSMQAIMASGGGEDTRARRAQIRAEMAAACGKAAEHVSAGGFAPRGGRKLVCVRTCDGYFFPMQNRPEDGDAEGLCQALCPGAETAVYRMPEGGAIQEAVSLRGDAYASLPNALKYRTSVDKSCACKKPDQSWTEALARAETMIGRRNSDVVVDAKLAAQMSQAVNGKAMAQTRKSPASRRSREDVDVVVTPATPTAGPSSTISAAAARKVRDVAPELATSQSLDDPDIETGSVVGRKP